MQQVKALSASCASDMSAVDDVDDDLDATAMDVCSNS
jgi:hypothetical protein